MNTKNIMKLGIILAIMAVLCIGCIGAASAGIVESATVTPENSAIITYSDKIDGAYSFTKEIAGSKTVYIKINPRKVDNVPYGVNTVTFNSNPATLVKISDGAYYYSAIMPAEGNARADVTMIANSGICGDGLSWKVIGTALEITYDGVGSGVMNDFSAEKSWGFAITSVSLPVGLTTIGNSAFANCNITGSFTIPSSVTSIAGQAFKGCSGLTSISIPSSVTSIGESAFQNCNGLISVNIPGSIKFMGNEVFAFCNGLTSVTISNGVTTIGNSAFWDCEQLTTVSLPSSVETISDSAFKDCEKLSSITIPSNVKHIGISAFSKCKGLNGTLTIPNSVETIGDSAFIDCSGLTSLVLPSGIKTISPSTFMGCSGLTSVVLPASVTNVGENAFKNCSGVKMVAINGNDYIIGKDAFNGCNNPVFYLTGNLKTTDMQYVVFLNEGILADGFTQVDKNLPALNQVSKGTQTVLEWNTAKDFTGSAITALTDTNKVAYAKWNPVLSFDANGGEGSMNPVSLTFGGSYTLPECQFTAPASPNPDRVLTFQGWRIHSTNNTDYTWHKVGDVITGIKEDITLFPVWEVQPEAGSSWTGVDNVDDFNAGGKYVYLKGYVEAIQNVQFNLNKHVNLNGQIISLGVTQTQQESFAVKNGETFILTDCDSFVKRTFAENNNRLKIEDSNWSHLISGGLIYNPIDDGSIMMTHGLFVLSGGKFEMYGGNIVGFGNQIDFGSVLLVKGGEAIIYGGSIQGNRQLYSSGGCIYAIDDGGNNGLLKIYGGKIMNNWLKDTSCICLSGDKSSLEIGGNAVISNNNGYNVGLNNNNKPLQVSTTYPLVSGAKIGVTLGGGYGYVTSNYTEGIENYFFSDSDKSYVDVIVDEDGGKHVILKKKCGDNLGWNLDDNGLLTIYELDTNKKTGGMYNDWGSVEDVPWHTSRSLIKNISLPDGLTSIGNYAFTDCTNITGDLALPSSVEKIGKFAFKNCDWIRGTLVMPENLTTIGGGAFSNCKNITRVIFKYSGNTGFIAEGESVFNECTSLMALEFNGGFGFPGSDGLGKNNKTEGVIYVLEGTVTTDDLMNHPVFPGDNVGDNNWVVMQKIVDSYYQLWDSIDGSSSYGETMHLTESNAPTVDGYCLKNWTDEAGNVVNEVVKFESELKWRDIYLNLNELTTVTIKAGTGGKVDCTSISDVLIGTPISISSNILTVGDTNVTATANSGYTFNNWTCNGGEVPETVTEDMVIQANFKAIPTPSHGVSSSFKGETNVVDGVVHFDRSVTVTDAYVPGATEAKLTPITTPSGAYYAFKLEAKGYSGEGGIKFQVQLDVIESKGYTTNDVVLVKDEENLPTTLVETDGQYAVYNAEIDGNGDYVIGFEKGATEPAVSDTKKTLTNEKTATFGYESEYATGVTMSNNTSGTVEVKYNTDKIYGGEVFTNKVELVQQGGTGAMVIKTMGIKEAPVLIFSKEGGKEESFHKTFSIDADVNSGKVIQVEFKVPLSELKAKNFTTSDVILYHGNEETGEWIPLDTYLVKTDGTYAYYKANTDGASPFGIMFMKDKTIIEDSSKTTTDSTAKSPMPILAVLAGFGAAAVFGLRMRR